MRADADDAVGGGESIASPAGTGFLGRTRNPAPRRVAYLHLVILAGIGIFVLISGIHRYDAVQPIAGGQTTAGTIVAVNTGQNCGRHGCSTYWVPTIQFTANGQDFTFAGPQSSRSLNAGEQVQVSYDPGNPASARDMSAGVGEAWVEIVLGAVAILAGLVSFVAGFRRVHAMFNLTSARDASGWVGHTGLHSVRGVSIGVVVMAAILILQFVIH